MRIHCWLLLLLFGGVGPVLAQDRTDSAQPPKSELIVPGLKLSTSLQRPATPENQMPVFLEGQEMKTLDKDRVNLSGGAAVRRQDSVLKADSITYNKASAEVEAVGGARLIRDGNVITGPSIRFNIDKDTGKIDHPNFWMSNGGSGVGSTADIYSKSRFSVTDMTYSACPCPEPSWYIQSDKVDIDYDENEGIARNAVLYFKSVPILASPYLTFPVKKERKSGFLIPTFGITSNTGFDYTQPYYFNLAPNYDATVQLRAMTKRGAQLGGEFRYLGQGYSGQVAGTYLPRDMETGTDRWLYSAQHFQSFGAGFWGNVNLNRVSDPNYFKDFSTIAVNQAPTVYLPNSAATGWANKYWNASATYLTFQTLQDPNTLSLTVPQYNKVPEFTFNGARFNFAGLDMQMDNTATWFQKPLGQNGQRLGPDGQRFMSYSQLTYPIVRPGWYVTPKIGLHMTQYETEWFQNTYGQPSNSRVLPIMSVDTGMTFERDASFFGKSAIQTLEPRAYYLRVPYQNQDQFPVYDTTLADFNFSQIFYENIYAGWDRISNANQLTLALTTRWLDSDTGFDRTSLSIGQRLYFEDQYVTLPGEVPRTDTKSEFLIGATSALTDTLSLGTTLQYNPYQSNWDRVQVGARWRPKRLATLSASYRYQRPPPPGATYQPQGQEQVSLSFQWPLTNKWYSVGRVDYSLLDQPSTQSKPGVTQAILGLEYKGDCCWTGRVIFQRFQVNVEKVNTAVFFQLELAGLGSLGTSPMGMLGKSIPGYENITPPIPNVSKFERYE